MTSQRVFIGVLCAFSVMTLGVGCSVASNANTAATSTAQSVTPSGPKPAVFEGLSAEDATKKIQLTNGSIIEMKQGLQGVGGKIADLFGVSGSAEAQREIVIQSFAPAHSADFQWKLTTTANGTTKQTTGSVVNAELQRSHALYLPGYWHEGEQRAMGTSAVWVSQDVYEDLVKLKNSSIDFGLFTPELVDTLPKNDDLQAAIAKMKEAAIAAGNKTDVYYMVADPEQTEKKLIINGKEVTVKVIAARNWFGEIVVLENKQYPLVLKVTLNPLVLAAVDSMSGSSYLSHAMGYEITELKDIQE